MQCVFLTMRRDLKCSEHQLRFLTPTDVWPSVNDLKCLYTSGFNFKAKKKKITTKLCASNTINDVTSFMVTELNFVSTIVRWRTSQLYVMDGNDSSAEGSLTKIWPSDCGVKASFLLFPRTFSRLNRTNSKSIPRERNANYRVVKAKNK